MITKTILILTISLVPVSLLAQQATGNNKFGWDQPAPQLTDAQGYTYKYYPDGSGTAQTFTGVTCTGAASPFQCVVQIPAFTPGNHTIQLSATNIAGESPKSSPFAFVFVVTPGAPTNIRIQ